MCLLSYEAQVNLRCLCYLRFDRGARTKATYFPGLKESKWNCPRGSRSKDFCIKLQCCGQGCQAAKGSSDLEAFPRDCSSFKSASSFFFFSWVSTMTAVFPFSDQGIAWCLLTCFCSIWQDTCPLLHVGIKKSEWRWLKHCFVYLTKYFELVMPSSGWGVTLLFGHS